MVFMTELLKQFQSRGLDVDRIAMTKARQDGKLTDKTSNTKHIAQVVAQYRQSWIPVKATDPDSQHEITQLHQQVAELRQRVGDTPPRRPHLPRALQHPAPTLPLSNVHFRATALLQLLQHSNPSACWPSLVLRIHGCPPTCPRLFARARSPNGSTDSSSHKRR